MSSFEERGGERPGTAMGRTALASASAAAKKSSGSGWSASASRRKLRAAASAAGGHRDRWLVSWADFMTLLFAFFVVLFATQQHSRIAMGKLSGAIHSGFAGERTGDDALRAPRQPGGAASPPRADQPVADFATAQPGVSSALEAGSATLAKGLPPPPLDLSAIEAELRQVLGPEIARNEVALLATGEGLVISYRELGFFQSGRAEVLPGQAARVLEAGAILARHGAWVRVEGHSDDQPIHNAMFRSNWELSTARAMTVLLLLVDGAHCDPVHMALAGYGPYRPIAENGTAQGRQKNRRVDLVVLRRPPTG